MHHCRRLERRARLRLARWLALSLILTTCQLDELITAPEAPEVPVASVQRITDSAALGSTSKSAIVVSLSHQGDRELRWIASVAQASPWLTLSTDSGVTPASIVITLDPVGLTLGDHGDTVIIARSVRPDVAVQIPVAFNIRPCDVVDVEAGATVADALSDVDCGAPHRPDHFAKLFRVRGDPSDSVSIELRSDAFAAHMLINAASDPSLTTLYEITDCRAAAGAGAGAACIEYIPLHDGALVVEVTTASAHAIGDFTLQVQPPRAPDPPFQLRQLAADSASPIPSGSSILSRTIVVSAVLTDDDATDALALEIELRSIAEPFTGQATSVSPSVVSAETAIARVSDLTDDTDYHWQVRAVDGTGRTSAWVAFGSNLAGEPDFHVDFDDPPAAPSGLVQYRNDGITLLPEGASIDERSLVLKAAVNDDDLQDLIRLDVEVRPIGTSFSNTATGASIAVANGETAEVIVTNLADETAYHWQARAVDQAGQQSAWLSFGSNTETDPDFLVSLRASQLSFTSQPADVVAGSTLSPVLVEARKPTGDVDVTFSGVVSLGIAAGTGSPGAVLSGTTAVVALNGVAAFADLTIDRAGAPYQLTAVTPGLPAVLSASFNVLAPPGDHLAVTTQPSSNARSDTPFPSQPRVAIRDAIGNPVALSGIPITASLASGPAAQLLGVATLNTGDDGAVQFLDLAISGPAGTYTLRFSDADARFSSAISAPIVLTASADHLALTVQPSSQALSGSPFAVQPVAVIRDADGNPVSLGGIPISASIASGPDATLLGVTIQTTDQTGTARFGNLAISGSAGLYTLRFADADGRLTPVVSASIEVAVAPGPADATTSTAVVPAGRAGTPTIMVVTVRDGNGNGMTGGGQTIAVNVATGSPNAGARVTVTDNRDSTYIASYTPTIAGTDLIDLTLNGTPISGSPYASVVAPGQPILLIRTQPSAIAQANKEFPQQPVLELRDQFGNAVTQAGIAITAAIASGSPELRGTTTITTDASGVATYTDLQIKGDEGTRTLQFSAPTLTSVESTPIQIVKGNPGPNADSTMLDLAAPGEFTNVFGGPERERLDGHRGLTSTRADQTAPVADEQVSHIMSAMVLVHD